MSEMSVKL